MNYEDQIERDAGQRKREAEKKYHAVSGYRRDMNKALSQRTSTAALKKLWEEGKTGVLLSLAAEQARNDCVNGILRLLEGVYQDEANQSSANLIAQIKRTRGQYEQRQNEIERVAPDYIGYRLALASSPDMAEKAYSKQKSDFSGIPMKLRDMEKMAREIHYTAEHEAWLDQIGLTSHGELAKQPK